MQLFKKNQNSYQTYYETPAINNIESIHDNWNRHCLGKMIQHRVSDQNIT